MSPQQISIIFLILAKLVCNDSNKLLEAFLSKLEGSKQGQKLTTQFVPEHPHKIKTISASRWFTCAIDDEGALFCWWDAKYNEQKTIIMIEGFEKGTTRMVTGRYSVCAENTSSLLVQLRCFSNRGVKGGEFDYELSIPTGFNSDLKGFSIGIEFMCAVREMDRRVLCWEYDVNYMIKRTPVEIPQGLRADKIHVSDVIACSISVDQDIYCWHLVPDKSYTLNFKQVGQYTMVQTGKFHFCAIEEPGNLHCWNRYGDTIEVKPLMLDDNQSISLDLNRICSLKTDRSFLCWDFQDKFERYPYENVKSISLGRDHLCFILNEGQIHCQKDFLGSTYLTIPEDLQINSQTIKVQSNYNLAINSSGHLRLDWIYPVVGGQLDVADDYSGGVISCTMYYFCATTKYGIVNCWNINYKTNKRLEKLETPSLEGVKALKVSGNYVCAIEFSNKIICWYYQHQRNSYQIKYIPNELRNGAVKLIAVYDKFTCAYQLNIVCWCSDKSKYSSSVEVIDLQVYKEKLCYVTTLHELKCFFIRDNSFRSDPVEKEVPSPYKTNIKAVSIYYDINCIIDNQNELACWFDKGLSIAYVPDEAKRNALSVSVGYYHICSRNRNNADNQIKLNCWKNENE